MREFLAYAGLQTINYTVLVVNLRAVASDRLLVALVTDAIYALLFFTIVEKIAHGKHGRNGKLGYVVGSLIGTYLGMLF